MELTYVKTNSVNLDSIPKVDGQLISVSENSRRYLDFDGIRQGIASEDEIEAIAGVYGAKNLYNYTYLTTQTFSDLTVTVNAGKSITVVGTNNSGAAKIFYTNSVAFDIPAGSYIVNGGLDASIENDIKVLFYRGDNYGVIHNEDVPYTFDSTTGCNFTIHVANGATVNATIKPMLRDARITDPTYVPYAMTNRELTERVTEQKVFVVGDGVKTIRDALYELYGLVDRNKLNPKSVFYYKNTSGGFIFYLPLIHATSSKIQFAGILDANSTDVYSSIYILNSNLSYNSRYDYTLITNTIANESTSIASVSHEFGIIY